METVIQAVDPHGAHTEALLRRAGTGAIEAALGAGRAQLLALFDGFEAEIGGDCLQIEYDPVLNLPLWELGHIGWFEEWWIARNSDRARGIAYDDRLPRSGSLLPRADALYDSSNVPHARRWRLALPDANATRAYLAAVREATLSLLRASSPHDDDLYFFRLVLFHEAMHREAWFMIAQHLGIDLGVTLPDASREHESTSGQLSVPRGMRCIGSSRSGFAFDNELDAHPQQVDAFRIDRSVVSWARYLPLIEQGGYDEPALWTRDGWDWRRQHNDGLPQHLRRGADGDWQQRRFGVWRPLDRSAPAVHLTMHEAVAWCRFAGRRLPTEAEWETAALLAAERCESFNWGAVWEWTASVFAPYPGFVAHPYRDYSQPFFDGRPVLRGGSSATARELLHPQYRNYFLPGRSDVFAGFRSCASG